MTAPPDSATAIRRQVVSRARSAGETCRDALERLHGVHARLNACITICEGPALEKAAALDARGDLDQLPLAGVPVAVKDNICTRGVQTTAASATLRGYVPPYDATVVERLDRAGAIVVAKTNCDEFAMGSSTEYSFIGAARNPWDPARTAGGSSGGSAIAVATRGVPLALGSETGGSVRQPAALCGVHGLKPTYGRVSRYGLLAFASSLDQVGGLAASVTDLAALFQVIAGPDPKDATSAHVPVGDYLAAAGGPIDGLRVGVPAALLAGVQPGVRKAFDEALATLRSAGASIHDVALPHSAHATPTYAVLVMAEASSNLARYDGVRFGARSGSTTVDGMYAATRAAFGSEVKRRILLGTFVLSAGYYDAYYMKAQQVRRLIRADFDRAFADVDVVATPTSPTTAFLIGERRDDPVQMYLADVLTASANLAGLPAISVPCGFEAGLPVGLQLTAAAWQEATLLRAAAAYERLTPWSAQRPPG